MVEKYEVWYEPAKENRMLYVYLPDNYYSTNEKYPVVYMFDGQNVFFNEDATYGTCWGMKEFLDGWWKKLIVVGVQCAPDQRRMSEYCPFDMNVSFFGDVQGRGEETMQWLVNSLKPHIDKTYRTYKRRECTAIAGSSMGGMMSLYGVIHYNTVFSKAAVVSPAIGNAEEHFLQELKEHTLKPDTKVFFSWGTDEWKGHSMEGLSKVIYRLEKEIQRQWAVTYIMCQKGGVHNEASWRRQIGTWMQFLWAD